jgi:hypothetical protein
MPPLTRPMLPYPDLHCLSDDLAAALVRLVRLINQLRVRRPDLDRMALSLETELDLRAAQLLIDHLDDVGDDFHLMLSPWGGRQLLDGPAPMSLS